jgi:hypothetical protein
MVAAGAKPWFNDACATRPCKAIHEKERPMGKLNPSQEQQDQFWAILRAAAPQMKAIELERLAIYYLQAAPTGSADPSAVVEAAFEACQTATPKRRFEWMASASSFAEFKTSKKALDVKRMASPANEPAASKDQAPSKDQTAKRPKNLTLPPAPDQLLTFWDHLKRSAPLWENAQALDNLLAYYLREPTSNAPAPLDVVSSHERAFFAAAPKDQREAMESLSRTAEFKAALKATRQAPSSKSMSRRAPKQ